MSFLLFGSLLWDCLRQLFLHQEDVSHVVGRDMVSILFDQRALFQILSGILTKLFIVELSIIASFVFLLVRDTTCSKQSCFVGSILLKNL